MKKVACYCRVSTEEQVKYGFSIQAQKEALEKYCKDNNYNYTFFIDEGISASSMKKRNALNDMLSKSIVFDMILFTKLDRLSRNVLDANNINKILQENKCTMKAIDEDDVDTSTADGMFMFNLKVSLAQREIGKTSERINFVFKNKRENGYVTSGTKKYGYDIVDKKFVINENEAENIRNLFNYFISVDGNMKKTYNFFIKNFGNKSYDCLHNYLRDSAYIGKYKLYKKNIYLDNYIPKIVNEETFNQVQRIIEMNNRIKSPIKKNDVIDLFSGLLYCPVCGKRLNKAIDYRVKNTLVRYNCYNAFTYKVGTTKKKCTNNLSIQEKNVENYLLANLENEFKKYKIKILSIQKNIKEVDNSTKIKVLERKLDKLKDLYLDDLIDKNKYKEDYNKYTKELEELKQEEISNTYIPPDLTKIEALFKKDYTKIYYSLDIEKRKQFWVSIIDKIYVSQGKIKEVIFL